MELSGFGGWPPNTLRERCRLSTSGMRASMCGRWPVPSLHLAHLKRPPGPNTLVHCWSRARSKTWSPRSPPYLRCRLSQQPHAVCRRSRWTTSFPMRHGCAIPPFAPRACRWAVASPKRLVKPWSAPERNAQACVGRPQDWMPSWPCVLLCSMRLTTTSGSTSMALSPDCLQLFHTPKSAGILAAIARHTVSGALPFWRAGIQGRQCHVRAAFIHHDQLLGVTLLPLLAKARSFLLLAFAGSQRLFFPWRQKSRRSSGSPALLEREEKGLALVTETKARELLPLCDGGLATKLSPAGAIEPADVLDQLLPPDCILFPPLGVGNRAPITQQIAVPILATADAAVTHLEPADAAFHLIVGAWEPLPVVALHQVWPQVAELLQERGEALLFQLRERAIGQVP